MCCVYFFTMCILGMICSPLNREKDFVFVYTALFQFIYQRMKRGTTELFPTHVTEKTILGLASDACATYHLKARWGYLHSYQR